VKIPKTVYFALIWHFDVRYDVALVATDGRESQSVSQMICMTTALGTLSQDEIRRAIWF
jgi:hypothetical protein